MGHFYRALNLIACLKRKSVPYVLLINDHGPACEQLLVRGIRFEKVPLEDIETNWESKIIGHHRISVWVNDRLDTSIQHADHVKHLGVKLATFDDRGTGAQAADLHIAALAFDDVEKLKGLRVLTGIEHLILNPEIEFCRRPRSHGGKLLVTLGGTDTYGVTKRVVELLKRRERVATIILGPGSKLEAILAERDSRLTIKYGVPSLIQEFAQYELAITGGGITAFEAAASGLPCIIVANERFEIPAARFLENLGCAVFAGFHEDMNEQMFDLEMNLAKMSRVGLENIKTDGVEKVSRELLSL